MSFTRRALIFGGGAVGLTVAVGAYEAAKTPPSLAGVTDADGAFLHDWIHVGRDGWVTLRTGQSEMGQGAFTGVATLVAEELGCRMDRMRVETGPASAVFKNFAVGREALAPDWGFARGRPEGLGGSILEFAAEKATQQITGGSSTLADRFDRARAAGAAARAMLIAAAARRWGAPAGECEARDSEIVHALSKRALGFGALAEAAAQEPLPATVTLKPPERWTLIGSPQVQRVDVPAKVDGSAVYGIDVRRPGMLFASVLHAPAFGATLASLDATAARASPGVRAVVILPAAVAVVADSNWRARAALDKLVATWKPPVAALGSAEIRKALATALDGAGKVEAVGDFAAAYAGAAKKLSADYVLPYLAHAAMEPMNATAEIRADAVEVWAPTQAQSLAVNDIAKAAGVSANKVRLHTTYLGGGFGRRLESDFVVEAVLVAKAVGKPVQVLWSREEDMRHDFYRPAAIVRAEGGLDAAGKPVALRLATASPSILARMFPILTWLGPDPTQFEGTVALPYAIPDRRADVATIASPVPVGSWRSVGHSITAFAKESFFDEMAHAAGADPVAFRLALLGDQPRLAAVLRLAAEKAGWGERLDKGRGRGVALHLSFGSACAHVLDVTVDGEGRLKVDRVVTAVDCGVIVNPDVVRAQVESGIVYGLSAALFGAVTIRDGAVEQDNFGSYDVVHMDQAPRIETHLIASREPPGGIGEPALPPIAPALANAIFAATGKRVRELPLSGQGFSA